MKDKELFYQIALTQIDQIGDKLARQLLQHFSSAEEIFNAPMKQLSAIAGFGERKAGALRSKIDEQRIWKEVEFIRKHDITPLFFNSEHYPKKLKTCADAPVMLYYKGTADLNHDKMVAIVGTRKNTEYGQRVTEELIEGLARQDIIIISGLALGIDIIAHRKALQCGLPTIGVIAHGMDTIYPAQHKHITKEMIRNGGLLTEYPSGTVPDRFNFPMRNRIVAGLCDVIVVAETEPKGGAMITAKLAASYNREIAAFPGRTKDKKSTGCNYLIRTHMAELITDAEDLMEMMNWQQKPVGRVVQPKLFAHLTDEETRVVAILEGSDGMHIDEAYLKAGIDITQLSSLLLTLELNGVVKSLPGKRYRLV